MKRIIAALIALGLAFTLFAQEDNFSKFSRLLSPEKLYLHTDRDVYCVGDTVRFKAYLKNASSFAEYGECNYIYVELLSSMYQSDYVLGKDVEKETLQFRAKIRRNWEDDSFTGYIVIPDNVITGISVIRAYTYWMLNKDAEYMFYKNIEIRNPLKDDYINNLVESNVRKASSYTSTGVKSPFEAKAKADPSLDVQFLPESGRCLADTRAVFGVKAIDSKGKGVKTTGKIYSDGTVVAVFMTDDHGFGKVRVPVAQDASLYAVVDGSDKKIPLPQAETSAAVINLNVDENLVKAVLIVRGLENYGVKYAVIHDGSEMYYKVRITDEKTVVNLPVEELTPGINNVAVVDASGHVFAERPFFVVPRLSQASITGMKEEYGAREKVSLDVTVNNEDNKPVDGDFSVSVMDDIYAPYTGEGYNIVSYTYLGSEIRSFVEDSWRYFDPERSMAEKTADADLLMLTQGWRYYDLPAIESGTLPMPACGKEYTQSLFGRVIAPLGRTAKRALISFSAPSINFRTVNQLDSAGYFALNGLIFPEKTRFLISASGLKGGKLYTPIIENEVFAKVIEYPKYLSQRAYDLRYKLAAMPDFYDSEGKPTVLLTESYISANKVGPQKNLSPYPEYRFKPGQYKTAEQLEPYSNYDIPSFLVSHYPGLRLGTLDTVGIPTTAILSKVNRVATGMTISDGWAPIVIFIDKFRSDFNDLASLVVGDLEGLAYVTGLDANKFVSTGDGVHTPPGVLLVKTKPGRNTPPNVSVMMPLGYQKPAKYYSPVYETAVQKRSREKMRATLYWNPNLKVKEGRGNLEFYTSDHKVPYTVLFQGVSSEGKPVVATAKIAR